MYTAKISKTTFNFDHNEKVILDEAFDVINNLQKMMEKDEYDTIKVDGDARAFIWIDDIDSALHTLEFLADNIDFVME